MGPLEAIMARGLILVHVIMVLTLKKKVMIQFLTTKKGNF